MKIIISNYRYFITGGPEKYLFSVQNLLRSAGHQIFPFSVHSSRNIFTEYQNMFLSPIDDEDSVYAHEYKKTPKTLLKILSRQFYCPEAFFKSRSFARFTGADLVYSLQFLNKMSPAVLDGFKSSGLPVVLRVSDFGLLCPQSHLFDGQSVCEKCLNGNFLHAVSNRCVMGSRFGGMIKGLALTFHRLLRCSDRIDAFVFPSHFTMDCFLRAGFPVKKLFHVPTFVDDADISPRYGNGEHILYFGRLVVEKGVHHLLEAYKSLPSNKPPLFIIGAISKTPYADSLMEKYKDDANFYSFMSKDEIAEYIQKAICVVIPSIWYDNLPNVLLESYAYGKPVIAPKHGCFLDLIKDGETGLFYDPGNVSDLREKLQWAMSNTAKMEIMGRSARAYIESDFTANVHYNKLMSVFNRVV